MNVWPENLPPPLRTVNVQPGNYPEAIEQASGRRIVRTWGHRSTDVELFGSSSTDRVTVQFRIKQTQEVEFKFFWHRVGMDMTWFTADWLPAMLYPNHKARILGYPRRKGITGVWMDFAVTLLVMPAALAVDAPPWPSGAGASEEPPPTTGETFLAVAHATSPFVSAYPLDEDAGVFGTKFANPATLPAGTGISVTFTSAADYIAVQHLVSPCISVYPWLPGGGFGTKVSDLSPVPNSAANPKRGCINFSPDDDYIAIADGSNLSPRISVFPWTGVFGTKVSDPSGLTTGDAAGIAFSPAADYIAVARGSVPRIAVYPWTGAFGTQVSDPSPAIPNSGEDVEFSLDGSFLAIAHLGNPPISVYSWSHGFGAKVADPLPAQGISTPGEGVTFSPDGNYIAVSSVQTSIIGAWPWMGGFGTKLPNAIPTPTTPNGRVRFSPSGNYIATAVNATPFFAAYVWGGSGFGAKMSNPVTLPTGAGYDVAFGFQEGG